MIDIDTLCELARDADILYLASPDRLTRSHAKHVKIVRTLNALGVEVRVADDTIDSIFNELVEYFQSEHYYLVRVKRNDEPKTINALAKLYKLLYGIYNKNMKGKL